MMDELKKMMASKKSAPGKMSEGEVQAKMDVIKELLDMAQQAMGNDVKGGLDEMHKVSVMAPDIDGLKDGLNMAEDLTDADPDAVNADDSDPTAAVDHAEETDEEQDGPADKSSVSKIMGPDGEEDDVMPNIFAQRKEKMKNSRNGY